MSYFLLPSWLHIYFLDILTSRMKSKWNSYLVSEYEYTYWIFNLDGGVHSMSLVDNTGSKNVRATFIWSWAGRAASFNQFQKKWNLPHRHAVVDPSPYCSKDPSRQSTGRNHRYLYRLSFEKLPRPVKLPRHPGKWSIILDESIEYTSD